MFCYTVLFFRFAQPRRLFSRPAAAAFQMVVHETRCLQKSVTNRRTEEFESPSFHIRAHRIRLRRCGGHLSQRTESVDDRPSVGKERQHVLVKAAELFLNGREQFRVTNGTLDFQPVPDNPFEPHEPFDIVRGHPCHFFRIEAMKGFRIVLKIK